MEIRKDRFGREITRTTEGGNEVFTISWAILKLPLGSSWEKAFEFFESHYEENSAAETNNS